MKLLLTFLYLAAVQTALTQPLGIKTIEGAGERTTLFRAGSIFPKWNPSTCDSIIVTSNWLFRSQANFIFGDTNNESLVLEYDYWRPDGSSPAFRPISAREVHIYGNRRGNRIASTNSLPLPEDFFNWSGPGIIGYQHQDDGDTRTVYRGSLTVTYTNNLYEGMAALYTYTCADNKGSSWVWYVRVAPREQKTVDFDLAGATKNANHAVKWFEITSFRVEPVIPFVEPREIIARETFERSQQ